MNTISSQKGVKPLIITAQTHLRIWKHIDKNKHFTFIIKDTSHRLEYRKSSELIRYKKNQFRLNLYPPLTRQNL